MLLVPVRLAVTRGGAPDDNADGGDAAVVDFPVVAGLLQSQLLVCL